MSEEREQVKSDVGDAAEQVKSGDFELHQLKETDEADDFELHLLKSGGVADQVKPQVRD